MTSEHHLSNLNFSNEFVEVTQFDLSVSDDQHQLLFEQFEHPQSTAAPQATDGGGKAETPSSVKAKENIETFSNDYVQRRNRNNIAVKKSREKSKQKGNTTVENIERLKVENVELEEKVDVLNKELSVLKKVFMDHARGFSGVGELPDLKQVEKILGHKLTDKLNTDTANNADEPSTSYNGR